MQPRSCCEAEEAQGLLSASHPATEPTRALGVLQNLLSASNGPSPTLLGRDRRIPAGSHTLPAAPAACWMQERCTRPHLPEPLGLSSGRGGAASPAAGKFCSVAWKSPLQEPDMLVINLQQVDDGSPSAALITEPSMGAEHLQDLTAPWGSVSGQPPPPTHRQHNKNNLLPAALAASSSSPCPGL